MNSLAGQPIADIALGALELRLLGTAHVSRTRAAAVARELESGAYDQIAVPTGIAVSSIPTRSAA